MSDKKVYYREKTVGSGVEPDTDNADDHPLNEKWGPQHKIKPIDELFKVFYQLRCNVLKDVPD